MKIVRIFGEMLWSIRKDGYSRDEFSQAFRNWQDVEYLEAFFEANRQDLMHGFYQFRTVEEAVWATIEEARAMEKRLLELCRRFRAGDPINLDAFFVNLHDQAYRASKLSKRKAKGPQKQSWLRLYAIKIDHGCYLIVGSAIKLSRTMEERPHTLDQLRNLECVRNYLQRQGIEDFEGFQEMVF